MSTREYAKNLFSAWSDDDFCNQPIFDKLLFQVLNGQRAVNTAGIQPINFTRWRKAMRDGATLPSVDDVKAALTRMENRGYVFTDEDTGEVLIRSRIRNDGLDKQPTMFLSALRQLAVIDSPKFAAVMHTELARMLSPDVQGDSDYAKRLRGLLNHASVAARTHLETLSEGYSEPFPNPIERPSSGPSPIGSSVPSRGPSPRPGEIGPSPRPSTEGSPRPSVYVSGSVSGSLTSVGGQVGGARTRTAEPGDPDPEPEEFCAKHRPHGDPDANCGPCGGHRKLHARWLKRQPERDTARTAAATQAANTRTATIKACDHCDEAGWLLDDDHTPIEPGQRCPHA